MMQLRRAQAGTCAALRPVPSCRPPCYRRGSTYTSPYTVPVLRRSILTHIMSKAPLRSDKPAIIDAATGKTITYRELPAAIARAVRSLQSMGVKHGTVVGLHMQNCAEFIIAYQALAALGAVATTSNSAYTAEELERQYKDCEVSYVITAGPCKQVAIDAVSKLKHVEVLDAAVLLQGSDTVVSGPAGTSVDTPDYHDPEPSDIAVLPYSSGTTGMPKGVMLTHRNIVSNVHQMLDCYDCHIGMKGSDVIIGVLPLYHIYGMQVQMNAALAMGATVVLIPKFDPQAFLGAMQKYRVTYAPLVPPLVQFMLRHPLVASYDLSALRCIINGAASLDAASQSAVAAKFGIACVQGYGMTEMSPISHVEQVHGEGTWHVQAGSIGTPVPSTEVQLVLPGTTTPMEIASTSRETPGELWVRGPQVMKGYLHNAKATAETLTPDGWCRTGDLVYMSTKPGQEGYAWVVDRAKELIKVKGMQVPPAELEALLLGHAGVMDAAVVGKADERAGEVPVAFVVRKREALKAQGQPEAVWGKVPEVDESALKAHVAAHAAEYKRLATVHFIDAIPKTASGKILRKDLRKLL